MTDVLAVDTERMDPVQAEMNLRFAHYLKAIEGVLFKNGLCALDEINKSALQSVALEKIDRFQKFINDTEAGINRHPNPEVRAQLMGNWEMSDEKRAVEHAIAEQQQLVRETMEDL